MLSFLQNSLFLCWFFFGYNLNFKLKIPFASEEGESSRGGFSKAAAVEFKRNLKLAAE